MLTPPLDVVTLQSSFDSSCRELLRSLHTDRQRQSASKIGHPNKFPVEVGELDETPSVSVAYKTTTESLGQTSLTPASIAKEVLPALLEIMPTSQIDTVGLKALFVSFLGSMWSTV